MAEDKKPILEFPCRFPIKVMGNVGDDFESAVLSIIHQYVPDLKEGAIQMNKSKGGNYLAMTIMIEATSREQLDNIYRALTACKHVIMAF